MTTFQPSGGPPIRTLTLPAFALLALAASRVDAGAVETHLNEITVPLATYTTARIAAIGALPAPTKAEKKELKLLKGLAKTLGKTAFFLKQDFAELAAAGKAAGKLGAAAGPLQAPLDQSLALADLSLSERAELVDDYLLVLLDAKHEAAVRKSMTAFSAALAASVAARTDAKRTAALVKADAAITKAVKEADRFLRMDRGDTLVPPIRLRSGDAVDQRGGRIAVPRDSGSPIAGASVVIGSGAFQTPIVVTLAPAASFIGGRDVSVGPAVAVSPDGLTVPGGAKVFVPFQLPADATTDNLLLFAKGPPAAPLVPSREEADGTLSASTATFSTFEAGIAGAPQGQPGGAYHLQTFVVNTSLDPADADLGGVLAGVLEQTITFRVNNTGSTSFPNFPVVTRTFVGAVPHHTDLAQNAFLGQADFTWATAGAGRFSFGLPLGGTAGVAHVEGTASDDGRVIAFTGRGGAFDFVAIGVRGGTTATLADLAGRWAAVELGVEFRNDAAEPFTTRFTDALRTFTADAAGAIAFDAQGARFQTDVTYHTDQSDPVHTRAENVLADSGTETWTLGPDGRVSSVQAQRFGWYDRDAHFLVTAQYDATRRNVTLMLATPQSASATAASIPGLYHVAGFDVGTSDGSPNARSSTHETTPLTGSFDVQSVTQATLSTDATTRAVYTLSGEPPLANMTWSLTASPVALGAASSPVTLSLDAAGNHRVLTDERWFAFSGDGRYVLGLTRGEPTRLTRGILLGVR